MHDALSETLHGYVMNGKLLEFSQNSFCFLCDDSFNAITRIVGTCGKQVAFQLCGGEVNEQTLCHQNEVNVVKTQLDEMYEMRGITFQRILPKRSQIIRKFHDTLLTMARPPWILTKNSRIFVRLEDFIR